jgi:arylsulfatase A-like enzyme
MASDGQNRAKVKQPPFYFSSVGRNAAPLLSTHWPHLRSAMLVSIALLYSLQLQIFAADSLESTDRPNIILIMADDVGYECFGCYGSEQYKTPVIDSLARRGMRFDHCYSQPLCTPSRVKMMTGLSNVRNYVAFSIMDPGQKTIGHYFRESGYETVIAGKWQLLGAEHYPKRFRGKGAWPQESGFDRSCLWQVDRLGSRYWKPALNVDGRHQTSESADTYGPEQVNEYVLDFLAEPHERPFLIYYPMILVHSPFLPTPDSASRSEKDKQQNFEEMVSYMDKLIGRVVEKTEQLGIADNTLILFTGDNGTHKAITSHLHGRDIVGGKGKMTDDGTRVPLVAYWPGKIAAGSTCTDLVDFSDFLPTLLAAAKSPSPKNIDGRSFFPQLLGKKGTARQWIYCYYCPRPESTKPARYVRNHEWKLYGDGRFFSLRSDPLEQSPLLTNRRAGAAFENFTTLQRAMDSMPAEGQLLLKLK